LWRRRKSENATIAAQNIAQGLLGFYKPPSLREQLVTSADAPLRANKGQKCLPKGGLFGE
jgi:hypothetical protein